MADESIVEKVLEKKLSYGSKAIASVAICFLGGLSMYITNGETGIGWAVLALIFIWG